MFVLRCFKHIARRLFCHGGACTKQVVEIKETQSRKYLQQANIGDGTRFYGIVDQVNPQLVTVGRHSVIGTHSATLTHCPIKGPAEVVIGDFCWIGFNVCILPGVKIGDHTVVGAGSVVTKNLPSGVIAAGNPARVIRSLTGDEKQQLQHRLLNSLPMGKAAVD